VVCQRITFWFSSFTYLVPVLPLLLDSSPPPFLPCREMSRWPNVCLPNAEKGRRILPNSKASTRRPPMSIWGNNQGKVGSPTQVQRDSYQIQHRGDAGRFPCVTGRCRCDWEENASGGLIRCWRQVPLGSAQCTRIVRGAEE
jgi:hypothetical protein